MSGDTVVILDPCLNILERLGLSPITYIYFGCSVLTLLSDKLADDIDLDLFIYFAVFSVSVL